MGSTVETDQCADLLLGHAGEAIDRRREPGEAEIQLGRFDRGRDRLNRRIGALDLGSGRFNLRLRGLHLSLRRHVILRGVVHVLLGDGLLFRQWGVPVDIELGSYLIGFRYGQLCFGLREPCLGLRQLPVGLCELALALLDNGLERPRIDLKKQLPFLYEGAFRVVLLQQVAGHLSLDVGVDESVQRADPFTVDRDILLLDLYHFHGRRIGSLRPLCAGRAANRTNRAYANQAGRHPGTNWPRRNSHNFRSPWRAHTPQNVR
jgi:hypothetical protein